MENKTLQKTARLEARIDQGLYAALRHVASTQGRTVTDFVITALQDAIRDALEDTSIIRLSLGDQEVFARALLYPPEEAPALGRAFDRRSARLGE
jgi:uncharacterized protein (DUF1778 family)